MVTASFPIRNLNLNLPVAPVPVPTDDAEGDLKALDACLISNRQMIAAAEGAMKIRNGERDELRLQISHEQDALQHEIQRTQKLLDDLTQLRKARNLIMLATGAGVAFTMMGMAPALAAGGAVLGLGAAIASVCLVSKADCRLSETRIQRNSLEEGLCGAHNAANRLDADVKDLRNVIGLAEQAIHDARRRAEMLRMAHALNGARGGSVAMQGETVLIGGIRVPRTLRRA